MKTAKFYYPARGSPSCLASSFAFAPSSPESYRNTHEAFFFASGPAAGGNSRTIQSKRPLSADVVVASLRSYVTEATRDVWTSLHDGERYFRGAARASAAARFICTCAVRGRRSLHRMLSRMLLHQLLQ